MKKKQAKMAAVEEKLVPCFRCGSTDLVQIAAKCNDLCRVTRGGQEVAVDRRGTTWGYVPGDLGLGSDDNYVEFTYCRKCGQLQNEEFRA
jgi:hypothetical protein